MNQVNMKSLGLILAVSFFLGFGVPAGAAEFPAKPITLVIPFVPGGTTDLTARAIASAARKYLGQPVICENKPGGGGSVGMGLVQVKPPDGYTLGVYTTPTTVAWHMGLLNFNPVNDLTHLISYGTYLSGIAVRADSPWNTIQEFIKYSKENPRKVSYGTPGIGTATHLSMEELGFLAGGVQWTHIPYKGAAECDTALLGGHVDSVCASSSWAPLVDAGKFRLLLTLGFQRSSRYPNVPIPREIGYDMVCRLHLGLCGPKGMAKPIVGKLHDAFKKAMDDPEFLAVMKKFDMGLYYLSPEDNEKNILKDSGEIRKVVERLGLQKKK